MPATALNSAPSRLARLGWLVFTLLACAHFSLLYLWRDSQFLDLALYARGGVQVPYQTRILMAWVLRYTAESARLGPALVRITTHLPKEFHDPNLVVLLVVNFFAMLVAVLAARASLLYLTGADGESLQARQFASWAALLTIYMCYFNLIAVYGLTYALPYDVTSLAFFSVGVWMVLTRRYWLLLPVFALGTLNRETFCFITIFLALYAWFSAPTAERNSRNHLLRAAALQVVLQSAIWLAIRVWMHHKFLHNLPDAGQNGVADWQLRHNLRFISNPPQWPLFLALFGFALPLFFHSYRWISDRALAKSTAIVLALWGVAMMIVGIIVEVRIFNELTAFLVPCLGLIVWNRWVLPTSRSHQLDAGEPTAA